MSNEELYHEQSMGEMLTHFPEMTKKEVIAQAEQNAAQMFDSGELDELEVMASVVRLKAYVDAYEKQIRKGIDGTPEKTYSRCKVEFSMRNTGDRLDYEQDELYSQIQKKLKDRTELLKLAYKSNEVFYDSEGVEVPKVGIKTHGGETLTVKF